MKTQEDTAGLGMEMATTAANNRLRESAPQLLEALERLIKAFDQSTEAAECYYDE